MPELAHEVPSRDELDIYLREHLAQSMLATLNRKPEQLSGLPPSDLARAFTFLSSLDGRTFADLAFHAIFTGLNRMNSLARNHPFWNNTNRRPTIYKLGDSCHMELIESPHDPELLWAEAIRPVWWGSGDFGQDAWLELSRLPNFDVRWPIYAALIVHLTSDFTEERVSKFLSEANLIREAIPILLQLATETEGLTMTWANQVLHLIETDKILGKSSPR